MRTVYIVVGAFVVLIVIAIAFARFQQNRAMEAAIATPTPAPVRSGQPTTAPIQLQDGVALGAPYFKPSNTGADTPQGGHGQPVDGIMCAGMEYATLHVHSHLAILNHGKPIQVPRLLGGTPTASGGCLYWIHTHDASGTLHVESDNTLYHVPQTGALYTLGDVLALWGIPVSSTQIGPYSGQVTVWTSGQVARGGPGTNGEVPSNTYTLYSGDMTQIPLYSHEVIWVLIGTGNPIGASLPNVNFFDEW